MRNCLFLICLGGLFLLQPFLNADSNGATWFSDDAIKCTILLEKARGDSIKPHGTGFLIYNYSNKGRPIIVTCAHLLKGTEIYVSVTAHREYLEYIDKEIKGKHSHCLSIDEFDWLVVDEKLRCRVKLEKDKTFVTHPTLDIAAFPIAIGNRVSIKETSIEITEIAGIPQSAIKQRSEIKLGDDTYFVGFPFSIGTTSTVLRPLIRSGCIAWLSPESDTFILDALSYSGNSGGPVFLKWDEDVKLIGMISGHRGIAIQGIEIENVGLAYCLWLDDMVDVIERAKKLR